MMFVELLYLEKRNFSRDETAINQLKQGEHLQWRLWVIRTLGLSAMALWKVTRQLRAEKWGCGKLQGVCGSPQWVCGKLQGRCGLTAGVTCWWAGVDTL